MNSKLHHDIKQENELQNLSNILPNTNNCKLILTNLLNK